MNVSKFEAISLKDKVRKSDRLDLGGCAETRDK